MQTMEKKCDLDGMVVALAAGDDQVWGEFMQTPLYRAAKKYLANCFGSDGEDLMQEAAHDLYQALKRYLEQGKPAISLEGLFKTIVQRQANSYLERKYRRARIASQVSWEAENMENWWGEDGLGDLERLEDGLDLNRRVPALCAALSTAAITKEDWEIIVRFYAYQESDKEIAAVLHKSVNTIKSRRQRAMARLQSQLVRAKEVLA